MSRSGSAWFESQCFDPSRKLLLIWIWIPIRFLSHTYSTIYVRICEIIRERTIVRWYRRIVFPRDMYILSRHYAIRYFNIFFMLRWLVSMRFNRALHEWITLRIIRRTVAEVSCINLLRTSKIRWFVLRAHFFSKRAHARFRGPPIKFSVELIEMLRRWPRVKGCASRLVYSWRRKKRKK